MVVLEKERKKRNKPKKINLLGTLQQYNQAVADDQAESKRRQEEAAAEAERQA